MTSEQANAVELPGQANREPSNGGRHLTPGLRAAGSPARGRVQRLLNLTDALLRETETLARDKAFSDEWNRLGALDLAAGIDFYDEVERFETGLIRLALDHTGGHQARAARLLRIKPTTLNSKIKLYGIEY